jgi:hypothetical protein
VTDLARTPLSDIGWSFLAGALAMLTFHQCAVGLFHAVGLYVVPPFDLRPVGPLGVPQVVNGAFWSGLWGIVLLYLCLPQMRRIMPGWAGGILFGFLAPPAFLFFVVAPLKGQPIAFAQTWGSMFRIVLAHAFWGFGMVVVYEGLRAAGTGLRRKARASD